ncbi:MAG: helix-turn-helix transcriptional regulator [Candidatus Aenigmarchaeota archaeon]|nr:helix-turn-helix transcriptional regulator [Candidatus Aenigmarchaeota archaeon]
MTCKILQMSHLIGRKWTIAILCEIAADNFDSFNGFLRKSKGRLTPRGLSIVLKEMENAGFVEKDGNGVASHYILTPKGMGLYKIIMQMKSWNVEWNNADSSCARKSCIECSYFMRG